MARHQCVGPRGRREETAAVGDCPTLPRYRLQLGDVETWACERHLHQAVKGFETTTSIAVSLTAA